MTKETYYVYLGTNGTIISPVHLEDIYYTTRVELTAGPKKQLTKDNINFVKNIMVPTDEVSEWMEVDV